MQKTSHANSLDSTMMKDEISHAEIKLSSAYSTMTNDENNHAEIKPSLTDSIIGENSHKPSLADSIKQRLQDFQKNQLNANDFTISRVPPDMFKGKKKYFEPSVISIGPYHRGKDKYKAMEHHKWGQLEDFLARNPQTNIDIYVEKLRSLEMQARRCYFEPIMLSSEDFVEMLLLDSCFILEFFIKKEFKDHSILAPMSENSWMTGRTFYDFLLLENQIPFFILQTLFDCLNLRQVDDWLITIITKHYDTIFEEEYSASVGNTNIHHLLHLFHHYSFMAPKLANTSNSNQISSSVTLRLLPRWLNYLSILFPSSMSCFISSRGDRSEENSSEHQSEEENSFSMLTVPCAKRLQEAGIVFKEKEEYSCLTDVTFNKGVLEIPRICMDDYLSSVWMNLVTFEQSNLPKEKRLITYYMSFMDDIIDTAEDVEILERSGILESYLNSDSETAFFFNRIVDYADIDPNYNYLAPVIDEVNEYTEATWPRWRAKFIRDYIFSPWAVFSLLAAFLLLSLTFIQTFCTAYPCNKH